MDESWEGPRLSRGEYWLLDSVVEVRLPLGLLADPEIEVALNKEGHGLSLEHLEETLVQMLDRGYVHMQKGDSPVCRPLAGDVRRALCEPHRTVRLGELSFFGLTELGGKTWEQFASPNWARFIVSEGDVDGQTELTCVDEDWLNSYLMAFEQQLKVDPDSVSTSVVRPWQATYWKELPSAHRVTLRAEDDLPGQVPSLEWYESAWCRWR